MIASTSQEERPGNFAGVTEPSSKTNTMNQLLTRKRVYSCRKPLRGRIEPQHQVKPIVGSNWTTKDMGELIQTRFRPCGIRRQDLETYEFIIELRPQEYPDAEQAAGQTIDVLKETERAGKSRAETAWGSTPVSDRSKLQNLQRISWIPALLLRLSSKCLDPAFVRKNDSPTEDGIYLSIQR